MLLAQRYVPQNFPIFPQTERTGHVCFSYENYIFIWGGCEEGADSMFLPYFENTELLRYDCEIENWQLIKVDHGDVPAGLSGSSAVMIYHNLYLFGGFKGYDKNTNSLYRLDLKTLIWKCLRPSGIPPIPVDKAAAWTYNQKIYVFGGYSNTDDHTINSGANIYGFQFVQHDIPWRGWINQFFEYDPMTNSWNIPICRGEPPSARAAHAVAIIGNRAYVFGGRHGEYRLNDLHCLNMDTFMCSGEMSIKGPKPEGRSWHSLTELKSGPLILYGGFSQFESPLSDCWMFDTTHELWQEIQLPFTLPRLWHCACRTVYDEVFIYGGCSGNILQRLRARGKIDDLIVIRVTPKSLIRLCIDRIIECRFTRAYRKYLPHSLQKTLDLRLGTCEQNFSEHSPVSSDTV